MNKGTKQGTEQAINLVKNILSHIQSIIFLSKSFTAKANPNPKL